MSDEIAGPDQYWVRTEAGQIMGPLTFVTIELLARQGVFGGTCEVSLDGVLFAPAAEIPQVRDAFAPESGSGEHAPIEPPPPPTGSTFDMNALDDLTFDDAGAPVPDLAPAAGAVPAGPPPGARPETAGPARPAAQRFHQAPMGERVHQAPMGERVHEAPAGEPAARAYVAPEGAVAPKTAVDQVVEGVPLPELIASGKLFAGTSLRLYYLAAATKSTGQLTLTTPENSSFQIFFKKGKPEQVRTSDPRWSLAGHLVKVGKITAEKAIEAEGARHRYGGEVVNALFALQLLDPSEAFGLLGDHGRVALERALQVDGGRFDWDSSAPIPNGTFPLGAPLALLGAAGRALEAPAAFRRLGSRIDCVVMKAGDGLAELADLALTAVETRVASAFDGTRSLAEIATAFAADAELVYRLGWFLGEVGFASFAMAVRSRPPEAPLLGPAPPPLGRPGEVLSDPELDALAAPMPPPGAVLPVGIDPSAPSPPPGYASGGRDATSGPPVVPQVAMPRAAPAPPVDPGPWSAPAESASMEMEMEELDMSAGPAPTEWIPPPAPAARPPPVETPGPPPPPATSTPGPVAARTPGPAAARPSARTPGPAAARPPERPPEKRPAPARASPSPSRTPGPTKATDVPALARLLERMAEQDHFEVLGLARTATSAQVKQAFLRLAREHHPDTAVVGSDPALRELKQDITARLNEANEQLGDDRRRADYLAQLAEGMTSDRVDLTSILAAEEAFNMAAILVKARKYAEALPELEKAIELNAKEGEFYAWRGFARFFAADDKRAILGEAMTDVHKALELNARCAIAHLFAARMSNILGSTSDAARSYRRCLDLDDANIEAQRELRLLESRANK